MKDFFVRWITFLVVFVALLGCGVVASAQTDNFGVQDTVYIDSVTAAPGQTVSVRVMAKTDELISSLSVPLFYNTDYLTLTEVSFAGSRVEHIATRLITPSLTASINGHFVVAVIKVAEAPMAVGDGLLFTLKFRVSDSALIGQTRIIDSLFYPPGGELLLVENQSSSIIRPAFKAGKIAVTGVNHPPMIPGLPTQVVNEGDSLKLSVLATDPDLQTVTLKMISAPAGMIFSSTGNGSGTLTWVPDYVGSNSSIGSPFKVTVQATDGMVSSERDIFVQVLNRNRAPILSAPATLSGAAGQPITFAVTATEPDFEALAWTNSGLPAGATFSSTAPHQFSWTPPLNASGNTSVTFVAADPFGAADTVSTVISVQKVTLYTMAIDTVRGYLGDFIDLTVTLNNQLPVTGFNLLLTYDPTATPYQSATKTGTRSESFSTFTVTPSDGGIQGNIRIVGASSGGSIPAGTGAIVKLKFRITSDISFAGYGVPVRFVFLDALTQNDNTLSDGSGVKIPRSEIAYSDGQVQIQSIGTVLIGDINLNNVPYDIGDAVYFTNFFISPGNYPFSILQYANSDANGDNLLATVADLVRLVNIIINGGSAPKMVEEHGLEGELMASADKATTTVTSHTDHGMGAILLELSGPIDQPVAITSLQKHMTLDYAVTDSTVKILLYSLTGESIAQGEQALLQIDGNWTVNRVECASQQGSVMAMSLSTAASLPDSYSLSQNYPNPFNPETQINFALPHGGQVRLEVFDVLGRQVTVLAEGEYPAGEHTVRWNGRTDSGSSAASGVYFYRLTTEAGAISKKMVLLK